MSFTSAECPVFAQDASAIGDAERRRPIGSSEWVPVRDEMIRKMTFEARDYVEVRGWLASVFTQDSPGRYAVEVLDDAIAAQIGNVVSLTTSMHDLVFSPPPVSPVMTLR